MTKLVDKLPDMDADEISSVFLCRECWNEVKDQDIVQEIGPSKFMPTPHHDEGVVK